MADLATAEDSKSKVIVRLNKGDGTFPANGVERSVLPSPVALAAADLNGDGMPELAVVHAGANHAVTVLFNAGDGTFASPSILRRGVWPLFIWPLLDRGHGHEHGRNARPRRRKS
jgi:hypothetical protein